MAEMKDRINDLVSTFVSEITRLARAAAVDTLQAALEGSGGGGGGGGRGRGRRGTGGGAAAVGGLGRARSKGAKRPKSEIAEIQARVLDHIKSNPGQRIEQINKVLGTRTSDLTLPLKKLIADGSITTKGARRATTYLPGGGGGGGRKRRGKSK